MADLGLRERIAKATLAAIDISPLRKWPIENCVVFCADIYVEAGFADPIANYRERYRTEEEAYEVMGLFGMHGLHVRVAKKMGWPRIEVSEARDGDWGLCKSEAGPTSAIRFRNAWVNSREGGFAVLTDADVIAAWKVC